MQDEEVNAEKIITVKYTAYAVAKRKHEFLRYQCSALTNIELASQLGAGQL